MDSRRKRFFAAASICQPKNPVHLNIGEQAGLSGWTFRTATHPFDDHRMALAELPMILHGETDSNNPQIRYDSFLYLTAVRLNGSTDLGAGFGLALHGSDSDARHSILDKQNVTGFVHCFETAPAYRDTTQIRVAWNFAAGTTKPDVATFRGIPRVTQISRTLIFIEKQMSERWSDGDPPVDESALSGRTASIATGDRMAIGIPWLSRDHELIGEADLSNLIPAIGKVKGLAESTA